MKTMFTAAVAAFVLAAGPLAAPRVFAGEGNSLAAVEEPLAAAQIASGPATPNTGSEAEPGFAGRWLTQSNLATRDAGAETYQDFSGAPTLDSAVRDVAGLHRYAINPVG